MPARHTTLRQSGTSWPTPGSPDNAASDAIAAGLWQVGWWVELSIGSGATVEGEAPSAGCSIGLYPGHTNQSPEDWAAYTAADLTSGAANSFRCLTWSAVGEGEAMASDGFALGWTFVPDATYQLQIDDDSGFGSPLVDVLPTQPYYQPQTSLAGGNYYWRLRVILGVGQSAWSAPALVTVAPVAGYAAESDTSAAPSVGPRVELTMTWLRQRKDTRLLCLRW